MFTTLANSKEIECDELGNDKRLSFQEKAQNHKRNIKNVVKQSLCRNKVIYQDFKKFLEEDRETRLKTLNDAYLPHADWSQPASELFDQNMLIIMKTNNLCVAESKGGSGKVNLYACNEVGRRGLWDTIERLVAEDGSVVPRSKMKTRESKAWKEARPTRNYVQFKHSGKCLTVPLPNKPSDSNKLEKLLKHFENLSKNPPTGVRKNSLVMKPCRDDAWGQLWKLTVFTDNKNSMETGYRMRERDGNFCMRPETVKAHNNHKGEPVDLVIFPCLGSPHESFELREMKNGHVPVWYDHNGVIKSDNGFCLDVPAHPMSSKMSGSAVFLEKCKDDIFDRWDFVVEYDKKIKIINDYTGYCLYPYVKGEGSLPGVEHNQLVQRPCSDLNHLDWSLKLISEESNFFQIESTDRKTDKGSGLCIIADEYSPDETLVKVFVKDCEPQSRGRWIFGHWEGQALWVEGLETNTSHSKRDKCDKTMSLGTANDISCDFWVDREISFSIEGVEVASTAKNGICRVIFGDYDNKRHEIFPGTWDGRKCSYVKNSAKKDDVWDSRKSHDTLDAELEILTGLTDEGITGLDHRCSEWKESSKGVPNSHNIKAKSGFQQEAASPFLIGGSQTDHHFYLCRQKINTGQWLYSYQSENIGCKVSKENESNLIGKSEILTFKTQCNK